jgi:Na+/melibiose symporter-like transporter
MPAFYAETLGLGLATVGSVLVAARIVDILSDPAIGWLSDRSKSRWGRRRPWIVAGAIVSSVALIGLFIPPSAPSEGYLLVAAATLYVGYTMVVVPYIAWGAELSPDYHRRSTITSGRIGAILAGILTAVTLASVASLLGGDERDVLAILAWTAAAASIITVIILVVNVREPKFSIRPSKSIWSDWRGVLTNQPFRRLLAAWAVNGMANSVPASVFPLYLQFGLGVESSIRNVLILLYFACGIAAIPIWLRATRRFGKHRSWCVAMVLACAAFLCVPLIPYGGIGWFVIFSIVVGATLGADLALPPSMQADVLDLDRLHYGSERAGIFFAIWNMASKLSQGLAVGGAFWALDLSGFESAKQSGVQGFFALAVIYGWVPAVLKGLAAIITWRYPLTERRHEEIRQALELRDSNGQNDMQA